MFRVRIPAGTTNLGAGFDCLGLALALYNTLTVEPSDTLSFVLAPEDRGKIPCDEENLVWQAMKAAFEAAGQPCRPVRITPVNGIPMVRGLGSSAACIVGGIAAADHLMGGRLTTDQKLDLAAYMDGHPDNIAPALLGGLTAAAMDQGRVRVVRALPHPGFTFYAMIPSFELSTKKARAVLPDSFSRADAVHNLTRSTLMYASLTAGRPENLWAACDDRFHQPYRKAMIPGFDAILAAAREFGAAGAWLSGAGPSLAAAVWGDTAVFESIMKDYLSGLPEGWELRSLSVAAEGTVVEPA